MKHARVAYGGAFHQAIMLADGMLKLEDGRVLSEDQVVWLPPLQPQTIFALALNYADHAKELAEKSSKETGSFLKAPVVEPVIFLKGPNTLIGHQGFTKRPEGAEFMHYECELGVVIGRSGKRISCANAMDYVAGYTVVNDYAIRNFLEGYYRPNLRVKSRDTCTPIGPWLVDRDDIADPMDLVLTTHVNGVLTQEGNTKDMIHDIGALIEYISEIMTLNPGDVIMTGTPKGSVDVFPGDKVVCEVEGIGKLVNTIVADWQVTS